MMADFPRGSDTPAVLATHRFLVADTDQAPAPFEDMSVPQLLAYLFTPPVGIGTSVPEAPLHVLIGGTPFVPNPNTTLLLQNTPDAAAGVILSLLSGNAGNAQVSFGDTDDQFAGRLVFQHGSDAFEWWLGGSEKMTLGAAGDLSFDGPATLKEQTSEPAHPADGESVTWLSDGTGNGNAGDVMRKITQGAETRLFTVSLYSSGSIL